MTTTLFNLGIYLVFFCALHSLTAATGFKARMKKLLGARLFDGWYRLLYTFLSTLTLLPIAGWLRVSSPAVWQVTGIFHYLFIGISAFGAVGILVALVQIDWQSFVGLRQVMRYFRKETDAPLQESLVTTGLYRYTRHPLYLFTLLLVWFNPVMTLAWLVLCVLMTLYIVIGSWLEELKMIGQFGQAYVTYQKAVPWLFLF